MPDMSDEELDALFRQGAEKYPEERNLSAWLQMERKLDEAAMQRLVRRKVARFFAAELAVVGLASLIWLNFDKLPTLTGHGAEVSVNQLIKNPKEADTSLGKVSNKTSRKALADKSVQTSELAASGGAAATGTPYSTRHSDHQRRSTGASRSSFSSALALLTGQKSGVPRLAASSPVETGASASSEAARLATANPQPGSSDAAIDKTSTVKAPAQSSAEHSDPNSLSVSTPADSLARRQQAAVATAPTDSAARSPEAKHQAMRPPFRLSVGVMYAPELSAVHWSSLTTPGSDVGVSLEYRFTPRLRISTGVIQSVKKYAARGTDYHPPTAYWTNRLTYFDVYANCRILDLPLNLRYDVLSRNSYAVFASAGFSSLLMRSERYRYDYDYAGKPVSRSWGLDNGSNHFFSVLNLSAGYERTLRGRWSVQGEPFVKIPLGGIGFGKVRLSSAGAFFSLKYSLLPSQPVPQP